MSSRQRPGSEPTAESVGPNAWLVDEMYERYRADPSSVGESWRDFFDDYDDGRGNGRTAAAVTDAEPSAPEAEPPSGPSAPSPPPSGDGRAGADHAGADQAAPSGQPLRGAAARVVANMESSL